MRRRAARRLAPHRTQAPYGRGSVLALALLALSTLGCESLLTREAPYGTVRVEALSRSGVPLPDIGVQLYTGRRPMGYATTDASGRAVFRQVPPGNYGLFLSLPQEQYADLSEFSGGPPTNFRDRIRVDAGFDSTFGFTFARRGPGSIAAAVRDSAGAAIPGIRVDFYRSSGIVGGRLTGADGIARMDSVPIGVYGAIIAPPDWLGVPGAPIQFRDGLIVDRDIVPTVQFVLATCFGGITAQVRDQDDAPVTGIEVLRYSAVGNIERRALTDAAGTVAFPQVPCGEHGVALQPMAGYTVSFVRDSGFVDGLVITRGAALGATLRAIRN